MVISARKNDTVAPRVGLALSGGAARGMAHIGAIKAFEASGIAIDCIAGTSAGAVIGGAYAAGMSIDELESMARSLRWRHLGTMSFSRLGIQSNAKMEGMLRSRMPVTRFEQLEKPFAAVATDLSSGNMVVLSGEGDLPFAIRASCALPGWYAPVVDENGRQLVDGGLVSNVPSQAARALGADFVIAVDVNSEGAKFLGAPRSLFGVLLQSFVLAQQAAAAHEIDAADLVIRPAVGHIRWDEVSRAEELMAAGETAALAAVAEIKRLVAGNFEENEPGRLC